MPKSTPLPPTPNLIVMTGQFVVEEHISAHAEKNKASKCSHLEPMYSFIPVITETSRVFGPWTLTFLKELGHRNRREAKEEQSFSFLVQYLAVQGGNAVSALGTRGRGSWYMMCSGIVLCLNTTLFIVFFILLIFIFCIIVSIIPLLMNLLWLAFTLSIGLFGCFINLAFLLIAKPN